MKLKTLNKKQVDPVRALIRICAQLIHLSNKKRLTQEDKLSLGYLGAMGMVHTAKLARANRRLNNGV